MQIYIGASGFQYNCWSNGVFYSRGVKDRLRYALSRMTAIEINSAFFRIFPPNTVETSARNLPTDATMVL